MYTGFVVVEAAASKSTAPRLISAFLAPKIFAPLSAPA